MALTTDDSSNRVTVAETPYNKPLDKDLTSGNREAGDYYGYPNADAALASYYVLNRLLNLEEAEISESLSFREDKLREFINCLPQDAVTTLAEAAITESDGVSWNVSPETVTKIANRLNCPPDRIAEIFDQTLSNLPGLSFQGDYVYLGLIPAAVVLRKCLNGLAQDTWASKMATYFSPEFAAAIPPLPKSVFNPCLAAATGAIADAMLRLDKQGYFEGKHCAEPFCGSGILSLLGMRLGAASMTSIDINPEAVAYTGQLFATANIAQDRYRVVEADINKVGSSLGRFDSIIANPPLLPLDPETLMKLCVVCGIGQSDDTALRRLTHAICDTNFELFKAFFSWCQHSLNPEGSVILIASDWPERFGNGKFPSVTDLADRAGFVCTPVSSLLRPHGETYTTYQLSQIKY